jgi:hypothetical protein
MSECKCKTEYVGALELLHSGVRAFFRNEAKPLNQSVMISAMRDCMHRVTDMQQSGDDAATPCSCQSKEPVACECGDVFRSDSYGAGFMAAIGRCENCEAARHATSFPAETKEQKSSFGCGSASDVSAAGAPVNGVERDECYDLIDRQLRNTLDDEDYAQFSAALDTIYASPDAGKDARIAELEAVEAMRDEEIDSLREKHGNALLELDAGKDAKDAAMWKSAAEYWYGKFRVASFADAAEQDYPTKGALDAWFENVFAAEEAKRGE